MKKFAIMDGDMFFQRLEPNENYNRNARVIQTNAHSLSEYTPIFGHEPKWFDARTAHGYLDGLVESVRWDKEIFYKAYALICKEEK